MATIKDKMNNFNYQLLVVLIILLVITVVLYIYQRYYCNTEPYTAILYNIDAEVDEVDDDLEACEKKKKDLKQRIENRKARIKVMEDKKTQCLKDVEELTKTLNNLKLKRKHSPNDIPK